MVGGLSRNISIYGSDCFGFPVHSQGGPSTPVNEATSTNPDELMACFYAIMTGEALAPFKDSGYVSLEASTGGTCPSTYYTNHVSRFIRTYFDREP